MEPSPPIDPVLPRGLTVGDVMRRDVFTLPASTGVHAAMRALVERHISGAPVVDRGGTALGVVTLYDLCDLERRPRQTVADVMTSFILAVSAADPLLRAIRLMTSDEVHRVFVLDVGRIVGVLTGMDVLRAIAAASVSP
jgi:predicted transcriptional regulator